MVTIGNHETDYGIAHLVYDRSSHAFSEFEFFGAPVEDDRIYRVGIQSYHYKNFETAFAVPIEEVAKNGTPRMVATNSQEILEEHLSEHQNLDRVVSGRLVIN